MPAESNEPAPSAPAEAPRSIARVLNVLETLAAHSRGASLSEIAKSLEMPKSSTTVLLKAMVASGHLSLSDQRYRLGAASFDLARKITGARNDAAMYRQLLQDLSDKSLETAALTVIDPERKVVIYIDAIESPQPIRYSVSLGQNRPLYCTAAGQVMLAFQDEEFREAYLSQGEFARLTPHTLTTAEAIRLKLDRIRTQGFAVSIEEAVPGSVGIAAPIPNRDGSVTRALLIAGPAGRLEKRIEEMSTVLIGMAGRAIAEGTPRPSA